MKRAVTTIVLLSALPPLFWCGLGGRARAEDGVESAAKSAAKGAAEEAEGAAKESIGKKVDATKEAVEDSVDSAKKQAQEAAQGAAERAKEQAEEAAEALSEHAQEMAASAKDLADELVVSARERAALLVAGAAAGAAGVGAKIKAETGDLAQRARDETRRALIGMADALDNRAQESRLSARTASWEKLKARFLLSADRPTAELSEELGDHGYRLARLQRAKELADGVGDRSGVARCERMMEAEYARHKRRLDQMRKRQQQQEAEARAAARKATVEARGSSVRSRADEPRASTAHEPSVEAKP